jgi:hypothetical protein
MDREGEPRPVRAGDLWVALALFALFRLGLGLLRLPPATPVAVLVLAAVVTALGAIGLPVLILGRLALQVAARPRPLRAALGWLGVGLGVWLSCWLPELLGVPWGARAVLEVAQDVGKILAAGGAGVALSSALREPNILVPAGIFAAFADFVVVNFGTVKHALSTPKGMAMLQAVSARVPAVHPALMPMTIGPADFLFLGILLACAARFGMGVARTGTILALVLAGSLLLVPFVRAVPALAPMSVAFLAANWRYFRLTRQELAASLVVLGVAGALFVGYFLLLFQGKR